MRNTYNLNEFWVKTRGEGGRILRISRWIAIKLHFILPNIIGARNSDSIAYVRATAVHVARMNPVNQMELSVGCAAKRKTADRLRDRQTVSAWHRTGGGEPSRVPPSSLDLRGRIAKMIRYFLTVWLLQQSYCCVSYLESPYTFACTRIIWLKSFLI